MCFNGFNWFWSRIITPKGIVITINAELSDQMGRSGLAGEIDTKFWDKYGMTLLFSTFFVQWLYCYSTIYGSEPNILKWRNHNSCAS
jgi:type IV secretory pathway VirB10-like protein